MRPIGKPEQQYWQFALFLIILLVSTPFQAFPVSAQDTGGGGSEEDAFTPPEEEEQIDWNTVDLNSVSNTDLVNNFNQIPNTRIGELSDTQIKLFNNPEDIERIVEHIPDSDVGKLSQDQVNSVNDQQAIEKLANNLPENRLNELSTSQLQQVTDAGAVNRIALLIEPPSRINDLTAEQLKNIQSPQAQDRAYDSIPSDRVKELSQEQLKGILERAPDLHTKPDHAGEALRALHPNLANPNPVEFVFIEGIRYQNGKLLNTKLGAELDLSSLNTVLGTGTKQVTKIEATSDPDTGLNSFIITRAELPLTISSLSNDQIAKIDLLPDGGAIVTTTYGQTLFLDKGGITTINAEVGSAIITDEGTILNLDQLGVTITTHGQSRINPTIIEFDHIGKRVTVSGPGEIKSFDEAPERTGDFVLTNQGQSIVSIIFDEENRPQEVRGEKIDLTVYKQDVNGDFHEDNMGNNVWVNLEQGQINMLLWKGTPKGNFYGIGEVSSADGDGYNNFLDLQTDESGARQLRPIRSGEGAFISKALQINQAGESFEQEIKEKFANGEEVTIPLFDEEKRTMVNTPCLTLEACLALKEEHYSNERIQETLKKINERIIVPQGAKLLGTKIEISVPEILKEQGYHSELDPIDLENTPQNYIAVSRFFEGGKYDTGAVAKRGLVDITTEKFSTITESDTAFFSWTNLPRPDPDNPGATTTDAFIHDYSEGGEGIGSDPNRFLTIDWKTPVTYIDPQGNKYETKIFEGKLYRIRESGGQFMVIDDTGAQITTPTLRDEIVLNAKAPIRRVIHTRSEGQTRARIDATSLFEASLFNTATGGRLKEGFTYAPDAGVRMHFNPEPTADEVASGDFIANVVNINPATNKLDLALSTGALKRNKQSVSGFIDANEREEIYQQILPEIRAVERSFANPQILNAVVAPLLRKKQAGEITQEEFNRQLQLMELEFNEQTNRFTVSGDKGILGYVAPELIEPPPEGETAPPAPIITQIRTTLGEGTGLGLLVEAFQQSERGDRAQAKQTIRQALAIEGDDKLDTRTGVQALVDETLKDDGTAKFAQAKQIVEEFQGKIDPQDTFTRAQLELIKGGVIGKDTTLGDDRFTQAQQVIEGAKRDISSRIAQLISAGVTPEREQQLKAFEQSLLSQADRQIAQLVVTQLIGSGQTQLTPEVRAQLQQKVDAGLLTQRHIDQIEFTFQKNALSKAIADNNKEEVTRLLTILEPKADQLDSSSLATISNANRFVGELNKAEQFNRLAEETLASEAADKGFRSDEGFNIGVFQQTSEQLLQQRISILVQQGAQEQAADINPTAELFLASDVDNSRGGAKNNPIRNILAESYRHLGQREESDKIFNNVIANIKAARDEIFEEAQRGEAEFDVTANEELKELQSQLVQALIGKSENAKDANEFENELALLGEATTYAVSKEQENVLDQLKVNAHLRYAGSLAEGGNLEGQRTQLLNARRLVSDPNAGRQIDQMILQNRLQSAVKAGDTDNFAEQQTQLKEALKLAKNAGLETPELVEGLNAQLVSSYVNQANKAQESKDFNAQASALREAINLAGDAGLNDAQIKGLQLSMLRAQLSAADQAGIDKDFTQQNALIRDSEEEARNLLSTGKITQAEFDAFNFETKLKESEQFRALAQDPEKQRVFDQLTNVRQQLLLGNYEEANRLRKGIRQGQINALDIPQRYKDELSESLITATKFERLQRGMQILETTGRLAPGEAEVIRKQFGEVQQAQQRAREFEQNRQKREQEIADAADPVLKSRLKLAYELEELSIRHDVLTAAGVTRDQMAPSSRGLEGTQAASQLLRALGDEDLQEAVTRLQQLQAIPESQRTPLQQRQFQKAKEDFDSYAALTGLSYQLGTNWDKLVSPPRSENPRVNAINREVQFLAVQLYQPGDLVEHYSRHQTRDAGYVNPVTGKAYTDEELQDRNKNHELQQSRAEVYVNTIAQLLENEKGLSTNQQDPQKIAVLQRQLGIVATDVIAAFEARTKESGDVIAQVTSGELSRRQSQNAGRDVTRDLRDAAVLARVIGNANLKDQIDTATRQRLFNSFNQQIEDYSQTALSDPRITYSSASFTEAQNQQIRNAGQIGRLNRVSELQQSLISLANYDSKVQTQVFDGLKTNLLSADRLYTENERIWKNDIGWWDVFSEKEDGPRRQQQRDKKALEQGKVLLNSINALNTELRDQQLQELQQKFRASNENRVYANDALAQSQYGFQMWANLGDFAYGTQDEAQKLIDGEDNAGYFLLRGAVTTYAQEKETTLARQDAQNEATIERLEAIPEGERTTKQKEQLTTARSALVNSRLERQQLRGVQSDVRRSKDSEQRLAQAKASTPASHVGTVGHELGTNLGNAFSTPSDAYGDGVLTRTRRIVGGVAGSSIMALSKLTFGTVIPAVTDTYGELVGDHVEGTAGDWFSGVQSTSHKNQIATERALEAERNRDLTYGVVTGISQQSRDVRGAKATVDTNIRSLISTLKSNTAITKDVYDRIISGAPQTEDGRVAIEQAIKNHQIPAELQAELDRRGISKEDFLAAALQTVASADDNKDNGVYHEQLTQDSLTSLEVAALAGRREAQENLEAIKKYTADNFQFGWGDILNPAGTISKASIRITNFFSTDDDEYEAQLNQIEQANIYLATSGLFLDEVRKKSATNPDVTFHQALEGLSTVNRRAFVEGTVTGGSETLGKREISDRLKSAGVLNTDLGRELQQRQVETLHAGLANIEVAQGNTKEFIRHAGLTGQKEFQDYAKDFEIDFQTGTALLEGTKEIGNAIIFAAAFAKIGDLANKAAIGIRKLPGIRALVKTVDDVAVPITKSPTIGEAVGGHFNTMLNPKNLLLEGIEEAAEEIVGGIVDKATKSQVQLDAEGFRGGGELGQAAVILRDFAKTVIFGPKKSGGRSGNFEVVLERQKVTQVAAIETVVENRNDVNIDTELRGPEGEIFTIAEIDLAGLAAQLEADSNLGEVQIGQSPEGDIITLSRQEILNANAQSQFEAEMQLIQEDIGAVEDAQGDASLLIGEQTQAQLRFEAEQTRLKIDALNQEINQNKITPNSPEYADYQQQLQDLAQESLDAQSRLNLNAQELAADRESALTEQLQQTADAQQRQQLAAQLAAQRAQQRELEKNRFQIEAQGLVVQLQSPEVQADQQQRQQIGEQLAQNKVDQANAKLAALQAQQTALQSQANAAETEQGKTQAEESAQRINNLEIPLAQQGVKLSQLQQQLIQERQAEQTPEQQQRVADLQQVANDIAADIAITRADDAINTQRKQVNEKQQQLRQLEAEGKRDTFEYEQLRDETVVAEVELAANEFQTYAFLVQQHGNTQPAAQNDLITKANGAIETLKQGKRLVDIDQQLLLLQNPQTKFQVFEEVTTDEQVNDLIQALINEKSDIKQQLLQKRLSEKGGEVGPGEVQPGIFTEEGLPYEPGQVIGSIVEDIENSPEKGKVDEKVQETAKETTQQNMQEEMQNLPLSQEQKETLDDAVSEEYAACASPCALVIAQLQEGLRELFRIKQVPPEVIDQLVDVSVDARRLQTLEEYSQNLDDQTNQNNNIFGVLRLGIENLRQQGELDTPLKQATASVIEANALIAQAKLLNVDAEQKLSFLTQAEQKIQESIQELSAPSQSPLTQQRQDDFRVELRGLQRVINEQRTTAEQQVEQIQEQAQQQVVEEVLPLPEQIEAPRAAQETVTLPLEDILFTAATQELVDQFNAEFSQVSENAQTSEDLEIGYRQIKRSVSDRLLVTDPQQRQALETSFERFFEQEAQKFRQQEQTEDQEKEEVRRQSDREFVDLYNEQKNLDDRLEQAVQDGTATQEFVRRIRIQKAVYYDRTLPTKTQPVTDLRDVLLDPQISEALRDPSLPSTTTLGIAMVERPIPRSYLNKAGGFIFSDLVQQAEQQAMAQGIESLIAEYEQQSQTSPEAAQALARLQSVKVRDISGKIVLLGTYTQSDLELILQKYRESVGDSIVELVESDPRVAQYTQGDPTKASSWQKIKSSLDQRIENVVTSFVNDAPVIYSHVRNQLKLGQLIGAEYDTLQSDIDQAIAQLQQNNQNERAQIARETQGLQTDLNFLPELNGQEQQRLAVVDQQIKDMIRKYNVENFQDIPLNEAADSEIALIEEYFELTRRAETLRQIEINENKLAFIDAKEQAQIQRLSQLKQIDVNNAEQALSQVDDLAVLESDEVIGRTLDLVTQAKKNREKIATRLDSRSQGVESVPLFTIKSKYAEDVGKVFDKGKLLRDLEAAAKNLESVAAQLEEINDEILIENRQSPRDEQMIATLEASRGFAQEELEQAYDQYKYLEEKARHYTLKDPRYDDIYSEQGQAIGINEDLVSVEQLDELRADPAKTLTVASKKGDEHFTYFYDNEGNLHTITLDGDNYKALDTTLRGLSLLSPFFDTEFYDMHDKIGEIVRAYFQRGASVNEISNNLNRILLHGDAQLGIEPMTLSLRHPRDRAFERQQKSTTPLSAVERLEFQQRLNDYFSQTLTKQNLEALAQQRREVFGENAPEVQVIEELRGPPTETPQQFEQRIQAFITNTVITQGSIPAGLFLIIKTEKTTFGRVQVENNQFSEIDIPGIAEAGNYELTTIGVTNSHETRNEFFNAPSQQTNLESAGTRGLDAVDVIKAEGKRGTGTPVAEALARKNVAQVTPAAELAAESKSSSAVVSELVRSYKEEFQEELEIVSRTQKVAQELGTISPQEQRVMELVAERLVIAGKPVTNEQIAQELMLEKFIYDFMQLINNDVQIQSELNEECNNPTCGKAIAIEGGSAVNNDYVPGVSDRDINVFINGLKPDQQARLTQLLNQQRANLEPGLLSRVQFFVHDADTLTSAETSVDEVAFSTQPSASTSRALLWAQIFSQGEILHGQETFEELLGGKDLTQIALELPVTSQDGFELALRNEESFRALSPPVGRTEIHEWIKAASRVVLGRLTAQNPEYVKQQLVENRGLPESGLITAVAENSDRVTQEQMDIIDMMVTIRISDSATITPEQEQAITAFVNEEMELLQRSMADTQRLSVEEVRQVLEQGAAEQEQETQVDETPTQVGTQEVPTTRDVEAAPEAPIEIDLTLANKIPARTLKGALDVTVERVGGRPTGVIILNHPRDGSQIRVTGRGLQELLSIYQGSSADPAQRSISELDLINRQIRPGTDPLAEPFTLGDPEAVNLQVGYQETYNVQEQRDANGLPTGLYEVRLPRTGEVIAVSAKDLQSLIVQSDERQRQGDARAFAESAILARRQGQGTLRINGQDANVVFKGLAGEGLVAYAQRVTVTKPDGTPVDVIYKTAKEQAQTFYNFGAEQLLQQELVMNEVLEALRQRFNELAQNDPRINARLYEFLGATTNPQTGEFEGILIEEAKGGTAYDQSRPDVVEYQQQAQVLVELFAELGIIHRDLTLPNIAFDENGNIVPIDFGVARLFGDALDTLSPEQEAKLRVLLGDQQYEEVKRQVTLTDAETGQPIRKDQSPEVAQKIINLEKYNQEVNLAAALSRDVTLSFAGNNPNMPLEERIREVQEARDALKQRSNALLEFAFVAHDDLLDYDGEDSTQRVSAYGNKLISNNYAIDEAADARIAEIRALDAQQDLEDTLEETAKEEALQKISDEIQNNPDILQELTVEERSLMDTQAMEPLTKNYNGPCGSACDVSEAMRYAKIMEVLQQAGISNEVAADLVANVMENTVLHAIVDLSKLENRLDARNNPQQMQQYRNELELQLRQDLLTTTEQFTRALLPAIQDAYQKGEVSLLQQYLQSATPQLRQEIDRVIQTRRSAESQKQQVENLQRQREIAQIGLRAAVQQAEINPLIPVEELIADFLPDQVTDPQLRQQFSDYLRRVEQKGVPQQAPQVTQPPAQVQQARAGSINPALYPGGRFLSYQETAPQSINDAPGQALQGQSWEGVRIVSAGKSRAEQIDTQWLETNGFDATHTIEFSGVKYHVSKPYVDQKGRTFFALYFEDENGNVYARPMYRSRSNGPWRTMTFYTPGRRYGKGQRIEGEVDFPPQIYGPLDNLAQTAEPVAEETLEKFLVGVSRISRTRNDIPVGATFESPVNLAKLAIDELRREEELEQRRREEAQKQQGVLGFFRNLAKNIPLLGDALTEQTPEELVDAEYGEEAEYQTIEDFGHFEQNGQFVYDNPAYQPDMNTRIKGRPRFVAALGREVETYLVYSQNKNVVYEFAHDSSALAGDQATNAVWITTVQPTEFRPNSYGTNALRVPQSTLEGTSVQNMWGTPSDGPSFSLAQEAFAYDSERLAALQDEDENFLPYGQGVRVHKDYYDETQYTDQLEPVRQFKQALQIPQASIPESQRYDKEEPVSQVGEPRPGFDPSIFVPFSEGPKQAAEPETEPAPRPVDFDFLANPNYPLQDLGLMALYYTGEGINTNQPEQAARIEGLAKILNHHFSSLGGNDFYLVDVDGNRRPFFLRDITIAPQQNADGSTEYWLRIAQNEGFPLSRLKVIEKVSQQRLQQVQRVLESVSSPVVEGTRQQIGEEPLLALDFGNAQFTFSEQVTTPKEARESEQAMREGRPVVDPSQPPSVQIPVPLSSVEQAYRTSLDYEMNGIQKLLNDWKARGATQQEVELANTHIQNIELTIKEALQRGENVQFWQAEQQRIDAIKYHVKQQQDFYQALQQTNSLANDARREPPGSNLLGCATLACFVFDDDVEIDKAVQESESGDYQAASQRLNRMVEAYEQAYESDPNLDVNNDEKYQRVVRLKNHFDLLQNFDEYFDEAVSEIDELVQTPVAAERSAQSALRVNPKIPVSLETPYEELGSLRDEINADPKTIRGIRELFLKEGSNEPLSLQQTLDFLITYDSLPGISQSAQKQELYTTYRNVYGVDATMKRLKLPSTLRKTNQETISLLQSDLAQRERLLEEESRQYEQVIDVSQEDLGEELGLPGLGNVYIVERDGKKYVLKKRGRTYENENSAMQTIRNALRNFRRENPGKSSPLENIALSVQRAAFEGEPAILLEYVEGTQLDEAQSVSDDYFDQLDATITALEEIGIAHNDLHPGNLLVQDGNLKLTDFGASVNQEDYRYDYSSRDDKVVAGRHRQDYAHLQSAESFGVSAESGEFEIDLGPEFKADVAPLEIGSEARIDFNAIIRASSSPEQLRRFQQQFNDKYADYPQIIEGYSPFFDQEAPKAGTRTEVDARGQTIFDIEAPVTATSETAEITPGQQPVIDDKTQTRDPADAFAESRTVSKEEAIRSNIDLQRINELSTIDVNLRFLWRSQREAQRLAQRLFEDQTISNEEADAIDEEVDRLDTSQQIAAQRVLESMNKLRILADVRGEMYDYNTLIAELIEDAQIRGSTQEVEFWQAVSAADIEEDVTELGGQFLSDSQAETLQPDKTQKEILMENDDITNLYTQLKSDVIRFEIEDDGRIYIMSFDDGRVSLDELMQESSLTSNDFSALLLVLEDIIDFKGESVREKVNEFDRAFIHAVKEDTVGVESRFVDDFFDVNSFIELQDEQDKEAARLFLVKKQLEMQNILAVQRERQARQTSRRPTARAEPLAPDLQTEIYKSQLQLKLRDINQENDPVLRDAAVVRARQAIESLTRLDAHQESEEVRVLIDEANQAIEAVEQQKAQQREEQILKEAQELVDMIENSPVTQFFRDIFVSIPENQKDSKETLEEKIQDAQKDEPIGLVKGLHPITEEEPVTALYGAITNNNVDKIFITDLSDVFDKPTLGTKAVILRDFEGNYEVAFLSETEATHHRHALATIAGLESQTAQAFYDGDIGRGGPLLTRSAGFELQFDPVTQKITGIKQDSWITKRQKDQGITFEDYEYFILALFDHIDPELLSPELQSYLEWIDGSDDPQLEEMRDKLIPYYLIPADQRAAAA